MIPIYADGRHYDRMYPENPETARFWLSLARDYGDPILELACGTARKLLPLATAGFDVCGIDTAEPMLKEARRKAAEQAVNMSVEWGDIRSFDIGQRFPLILLTTNTICHLTTIDDFEQMAACVRKSLTPEGVFVVEVFVPDLNALVVPEDELKPFATYEEPDGTGRVELVYSSRYDPSTQIKHNTLFRVGPHGDKSPVGELPMRMYFPQELDALFRYNGFRIAKFGDLHRSPFTNRSSMQIFILSLANQKAG